MKYAATPRSTTTDTFYAESSDGCVDSSNATYLTARSGGALALYSGGTSFWVGQSLGYSVDLGYLGFDTSSLPDTDSVDSASLYLNVRYDDSSQDFDLEARLYDFGATLGTADFVPGADLSSHTRLAYINTSAIGTGEKRLTSESAFSAAINRTGSTRMLLCSSHTTAGTAPSPNDEDLELYASEMGTTYRPRLEITHSPAGGTPPGGDATWVTRAEHSFWTQRAKGSTFTFDITTDSHIGIQLGTASNWQSTLNGVAFDQPDFLVDLGDTVAMDDGSTSVPLGNTAAAEQKYKDTLPYFNTVSASSPIFLVAGNHEEQEAWHLQGTLANSLPIMGKNAEKKFYPEPESQQLLQRRLTHNARLERRPTRAGLLLLDLGRRALRRDQSLLDDDDQAVHHQCGRRGDRRNGLRRRWDWTLGADQFNWLKSTLANSNAKYKFVFSHQIVGGNGMTSPVNQVNYGHGGVDSANFVEWGGYDTNGTTYAWSDNRDTSVWGNQPIREMMEANGVTAFFHGHDHQMAYETANDMVYQACPSASFTGGFGNYTTGNTYTVRDSAGHTSTGRTVYADSTPGPRPPARHGRPGRGHRGVRQVQPDDHSRLLLQHGPRGSRQAGRRRLEQLCR